ncbi:MAG: nitroreductase family protein, partial [Traorella sp.]
LYKDNFDYFASHGMGILQGNIWNLLTEYNIGANLQHYNPLIDEAVKKQWNIPKEYDLCAQMVFGGIQSIPEPKDKIDDKLRYIVYK